MPLNPWARPRAAVDTETRTFTDGPDTFTLTFRPIGTTEAGVMVDQVENLVALYVTPPEGQPKLDFPPVGGEIVRMSRSLIEAACAIEALQPEDAAERYTAMDLIAMAHTLRPTTWAAVQAFSREVAGRAVKNDSGAAGAA